MANWTRRITRLGCIFAFAAGTMVPAASAMDLEVAIAGLRSQNGSVLVALYKGSETYLKKGGHHQVVVIPADSALPLGVIRDRPFFDAFLPAIAPSTHTGSVRNDEYSQNPCLRNEV